MVPIVDVECLKKCSASAYGAGGPGGPGGPGGRGAGEAGGAGGAEGAAATPVGKKLVLFRQNRCTVRAKTQ